MATANINNVIQLSKDGSVYASVNIAGSVVESDVQDKALFLMQADIAVNGHLTRFSFDLYHKGETLKVKVQFSEDRTHFNVNIIRPAIYVGQATLSIPGATAKKATKVSRTDTKPGNAFHDDDNLPTVK